MHTRIHYIQIDARIWMQANNFLNEITKAMPKIPSKHVENTRKVAPCTSFVAFILAIRDDFRVCVWVDCLHLCVRRLCMCSTFFDFLTSMSFY